ncbi:thiosulfate sulfurtransferase GlpE [bacterium]|nr:thiosulfate sulfurtransferase GlpE [bacterium]
MNLPEIPQIDIDEARRRLSEGKTLFVDVRDPMSFNRARVPGALRVSDANVEEFVRETDKERCLIVYCYHGHTSLGGAAYFLDQGFREVYSMIGGFEAWRMNNPVETG